MTQVSNDLPQGWVLSSLGDLAILNPKKQENSSGDTEVSFIPMKSVEPMTGVVDLSEARKVSEVQKGYTRFIDGDVLFAKITPCMENGKVAIVTGLRKGIGYGSTEFHVVRLNHALERKYFFFYLIQDGFRKEAQRNMTGTAGQLRVPIKYLKEAGVPVPPLNEQHRIVAKLEELFTNLDAGVEALKKVQAQIKRYRQAVLKYAFEGKLTAEWREAHKNELVPALVLLARIREERKKKLGGKYKEPPSVDPSDLPELPEGWEWVTLADIGHTVTGNTPSKTNTSYYGDDYPFYKPTDLNAGYSVRSSKDGLTDVGINHARVAPEKSTLVTCIGATIGKTGYVREAGAFNQQINAIIPEPSLVPEYIYFMCISPNLQKEIINKASSTTLPILNKGRFSILPFPLPPAEEQQRIVEDIERRFSIADEIEKVLEQSVGQSDRLRQSILKRAFEGKLVPQDPNDEPADKLLERIKEEQDKQISGAKVVRSKKGS